MSGLASGYSGGSYGGATYYSPVAVPSGEPSGTQAFSMGAQGTLLVIPGKNGGNPTVEIQSETGETTTLKPTIMGGMLRYSSGNSSQYITLPWSESNSANQGVSVTAGPVTNGNSAGTLTANGITVNISWMNPRPSANLYTKPQCSNGTCTVLVIANGMEYGVMSGVPQSGLDAFMQAAQSHLTPPAGIPTAPAPTAQCSGRFCTYTPTPQGPPSPVSGLASGYNGYGFTEAPPISPL